MSASAKNPYLVYEIAFLHFILTLFVEQRNAKITCHSWKDTLMKLIIAFSSVVLLSMQCRKSVNVDAPSCIEQKIRQIKSQSKWNPPATVSEYDYNGKKVYLFTSDCCDQYIELFDSNCNYLCAPSGGIAGHGDGKCADFYDKATLIRVVWKDTR